MHVPRNNRMQYRVSVRSLENISRTDTKSQNTGSVIRRYQWGTMQSLRSLWIIFMTGQAASQASTERKNCSKKKQEASPAFLQPKRHLLIMPRGQCFKMDLSGHKPLLKEPVLPCPSQGDDSLQAVSGYTSLDNSSRSERYRMLWSHPPLAKKSV